MPEAPKGTVLAFDFGEARIGVAQGEAELGMTHPLATVTGNSNDEKFEAIAKLVKEWQPKYFVVGLPMSSLYAESLLAEAQVFGRKQKSVLDQVAAQAILQGFFEGGAAEYFNGREE